MVSENQIMGLERSLINFLLNRKDIEEKVAGGVRRVKSLTLRIDDRNLKHLTFSVQIGVMEAKFSVETGLKEQGQCYGLDRYIRDWYQQPTIKFEVEEIIFGKSKHM